MGIRILGFLLAMGLSTGSWAATTGVAPNGGGSNESTTVLQKIRKNIRGTYINEFSGPYLRAPSGNIAGGGTNLLMVHYLQMSYILGSKWRVSLTQPFYQRVDEAPASEVDPFEPSDPYVTFTNTRVLGSDRYGTNLYAYIRYYFPFSKSTINASNDYSVKDKGNGQLRFTMIPSITFMDGALNLSGATLLYYRLPGKSSHDRAAHNNGNPNRENWIFIFDPILSYTVSDTTEAYLEYAFDTSHSTSGHWSKWKNGDYISPGVNLQLTKKFMVNPYLVWEPRWKELKNTGFGITAVYAFL